MGAKIEHLRQAIRYGSALERIWARLVAGGLDVTDLGEGSATIQFYKPTGESIAAAVDMTQVTTGEGEAAVGTAWFYYDLDASSVATWAKGMGYRAEVVFVSVTITYKMQMYLDVVVWPINEPLISSTYIDEQHPGWSDARHESASDWTRAINQAHLEMLEDLRTIKDNRGSFIYVNRILDRAKLFLVARAYTEDIIARQFVGETDDAREAYAAARQAALNQLNTLIVDYNDDLIEDADEEVSLSITFDH